MSKTKTMRRLAALLVTVILGATLSAVASAGWSNAFPVYTSAGQKFTIAAYEGGYAIKNDGSLWAWGGSGETYGDGREGYDNISETPVKVFSDVVSVRTTGRDTYVLKTDGSVWVCGSFWSLADVSSASSDFEIKDGVLIEYKGTGQEVIIPEGVHTLGYDCFAYNKNIVKVVIPSSVTTLNQGVFFDCSNLQVIVVPSSVVNINDAYVFDIGNEWPTAIPLLYIQENTAIHEYAVHKNISFSTKEPPPILVPLVLSTFTKIMDDVSAITAEIDYTGGVYAIKNDGTLVYWTYNEEISVLNGVKSIMPQIMDEDTDYLIDETGFLVAMRYAIKKDGTLWTWKQLMYHLPDLATLSQITDNVAQIIESFKDQSLDDSGNLYIPYIADWNENGDPVYKNEIIENVAAYSDSGYNYQLILKKDGTLWEKEKTVSRDVFRQIMDDVRLPDANPADEIEYSPIVVQDFNGHKYALYDVGMTWQEAKAYCERIGGHLATITSQEEQDFIESMIARGKRNNYWIGGWRISDTEFAWVTDEPMVFTNWAPYQPDSSLGDEDAMMIYKSGEPGNEWFRQFGGWNDFWPSGINGEEIFGLHNFGFICEWPDEPPTITVRDVEVGVSIEWTGSSGAVGYRIYRNENGGEKTLIYEGKADSTKFIDVNVKSNTTYTYTIAKLVANPGGGEPLEEPMAFDGGAILADKDGKPTSTETELGVDGSITIKTGTIRGAEIEGTRGFLSMQIDNPYMLVNGELMEIDPGRGTVPVIKNGRTLMPIRAAIEAMGGSVGWDEASRRVDLAFGSYSVEMTLGSKQFKANGEAKELDVLPQVINGRTMLPIRFVAENIGCEVAWVGSAREVIVVYKMQ